MKDNLPEINMGSKEKKGGFLGFLRGLGGGARGASGLGGSSGLGGAGIGGAAGAGGLFGGGLSSVVVVAGVLAVTGGAYLLRNAPPPQDAQFASASAKAGKEGKEYVPAILRQTSGQGSSLSMFTETNKGSGLSLSENPNAGKTAKDADAVDSDAANAAAGGAAETAVADAAGAGGEALPGMGGGSSLSSSLGGGGSGGKMNFGSKMGGAAAGGPGFSKNIGTGFQAMPKFQDRKSKMLAMKGGARTVYSSPGGGKSSKYSGSNKSWNQARGLKARQASYTGSNSSALRGNQDAAWDGTTASGDAGAAEGGGMGEGEDVVTSPSLDNAGGSGGGGGDTGGGIAVDVPDCSSANPPEVCKTLDPTDGMGTTCNNLIMAAALLALAGAVIIQISTAATGTLFGAPAAAALRAIGMAICAIAMMLAAMALVVAIAIGIKGQVGQGIIYGIGAGLAITAAGMAMWGSPQAAVINTMWFAAAAGISNMIANMMG